MTVDDARAPTSARLPTPGSSLDVARRALAVASDQSATLASHRARMQRLDDALPPVLRAVGEVQEAVAAVLDVGANNARDVLQLRRALEEVSGTIDVAAETVVGLRAEVKAASALLTEGPLLARSDRVEQLAQDLARAEARIAALEQRGREA